VDVGGKNPGSLLLCLSLVCPGAGLVWRWLYSGFLFDTCFVRCGAVVSVNVVLITLRARLF
jgi:hypothetical protein